MDGARLLEEKCREFSVEGAVTQIHPGPVVTTFEFKPDAGVKIAKITSLAEDLCLAMQAESVLIDRIPGKSTVGIQIPNAAREQISLRELLESELYRRSPSKLTLALGKTIHGEPYVADLATMPHLLIAGSTGTGKSVGINAMLTSILYRATPDDVRLIMIDPKRLELGMYEDIPHLLTPVVVDPKQAANALRWAVHEMEERYKTLAAEGVRNIEQYNRNVQQALTEKRTPQDGEQPRPLPFIVVVIDELADLMMVASNEVEQSIARLAQMARAVGIHLILATQRPSVDVITGLIKANMPTRISFRVSSKVDSRTILDGNGAEQLLGRGDMLMLPPASSRLIRLHGPYISEQESARLASYLRKQGKPTYDETITAEEKTAADGIDMEKDDLYDEAARIVVQSGQASISYLQRRLRVGFSRAARLVDMMEMEGLVSPADGAKAARSARRQAVLRRSRRAAPLSIRHDPMVKHLVAIALAALVALSGDGGAAGPRDVRRRDGAGAGGPPALADPAVLRVGAESRPDGGRVVRSRSCGSIRRAATATTRCGRPAGSSLEAFERFGKPARPGCRPAAAAPARGGIPDQQARATGSRGPVAASDAGGVRMRPAPEWHRHRLHTTEEGPRCRRGRGCCRERPGSGVARRA